MAEIRITKPDEAYLDVYKFGNTTPELIDGLVCEEVHIGPRKFPIDWNTVSLPFDVTTDELKEIFGSDAKIWTIEEMEWLSTEYENSAPEWNYNEDLKQLSSIALDWGVNYVLQFKEEHEGLIKANYPFVMKLSAAHNATADNPIIFYNKVIEVPDRVLFYKMQKGMYYAANILYINDDNPLNVLGIQNDIYITPDNEGYLILNAASTGKMGYTNYINKVKQIQTTGAFFFKIKDDSILN